ncbi:MAG: hypothetical protein ABWX67_08650 [Allosphingosinicella sp.]
MTPSLLLALAASAAPLDPASLWAGLAQALAPVEAMGACAHARPRYQDRYQRTFTAYVELEGAAEALFGRKPMLDRAVLPATGCSERAFAKYEAAAGAGLGTARQALGKLAVRMPGLWIGTLPVCRDDVASAVVEPLYEDGAMLGLSLTLRPALKPRLLSETQGRVGLTMSVRIDGEAVMAPRLHEPLSVGAMMLTGPERKALERIRAAALRPC